MYTYVYTHIRQQRGDISARGGADRPSEADSVMPRLRGSRGKFTPLKAPI